MSCGVAASVRQGDGLQEERRREKLRNSGHASPCPLYLQCEWRYCLTLLHLHYTSTIPQYLTHPHPPHHASPTSTSTYTISTIPHPPPPASTMPHPVHLPCTSPTPLHLHLYYLLYLTHPNKPSPNRTSTKWPHIPPLCLTHSNLRQPPPPHP